MSDDGDAANEPTEPAISSSLTFVDSAGISLDIGFDYASEDLYIRLYDGTDATKISLTPTQMNTLYRYLGFMMDEQQ